MPCLFLSGCLVRSGSSFTGCDAVRSLRAFLFLCVGLCLGGFSVFAFAGVSDYGRSMKLNAPSSSGARFSGAPIYDWSDAPSGWGRMNDINKINIGGKSFDVTGGRLFSPQTLAKGAVSFVRFGGVGWAGLMLAPLVWDAAQGWLYPGDDVNPADGPQGSYRNTLCGTRHSSPGDACLATNGCLPTVKWTGAWQKASGTYYACQRANGTYHASTVETLLVCPEGTVWNGSACSPAGDRPATDQEIEDAIYAELVARGMGSELARRLVEAGYNPPVDGIEIDGPSSIPGDTTTTTTSGPAGTTSTTTNTTHNMSYTTNTTNNTSTVTITNTTTSTTTTPDGTTTTETTEAAPEGSETEPPPEEKPFCELYPDASACANLDVPASVPNESEDVTVTLTPTGGFGSEGGSCPPPFPFVVQGRSYQISYAQACDFFSAVRPVVIAAAMLSALLIALGGYKRD